ncbi:nuclear-pore anchor isoform X2 [Zea mays]|uniref:Nuclear-pore anchor n=7 Tax=Zea mays TaxID=4577 RepID=A0A1D6QEV0_MAIZE|nr:nuclear-pore anchor isoform X2 [Zea mays]AQK56625.1 Nuclear-pore anchor [Zea mays]AQK56627.1 Nuclear-pore anchor [Zea mays]AQK56651.1 Nuclear-pore anchor [Zea mays]AQK56663.1 Nuclear-pore anchor [Zea mays]|eukprot:XP_008676555.1 nuclear-pore anchor isoform X2 [Zea mays]
MPLFISDEELRLLGGDTAAVAERADAAIRELRRQVDTVRAEADAAAIAAEQTCALLEQRYASLSAEFDRSKAEAAELTASAERRAAELASSQAEIHQLRIQAIAKDGEVERLKIEISELHKSKCQSLELIEQRDAEIKEKDGIIQSYYNKIVNLAETSAGKEARIQEVEAKFTHCQAICNRMTQEKELLEKHNVWLDEELKAKVKNLAELRKTNMDEEARLSASIAELEREISESSSSLRRSKERISELEQRVSYMEKELRSTKDTAAANEQRLGAELSTVKKLAELHQESSEEWSKKAGELEGVIKALETHLTQVEDEYKEKLEKETLSRRDLEKEAVNLKQKLEKCEFDLENTRKSSELSLVPLTSIAAGSSDVVDTTVQGLPISDAVNQNDLMVIPKVPSGVSGTALAASLLRDGWSLAKIYEKYQEATDAFLHERRGRRHAEAVLERVLHEIEEKAELILDERAEHERMVEAYAMMDQKLQQALLEHDNFENNVRNLKSELKRRERDHSVAQKEIDDLQKQVAVLLKECQDIQLRCGSSLPNVGYVASSSLVNVLSNVEHDIKDNMSFKDINGLVQQNVQLRNQIHMLSADLDKKDMELRESFQIELKKITDAAASRVEKVMKKSEEQAIMIESLHRSVAMYRKLCEEQQKARSNVESAPTTLQDSSRTDLMVLFEGSQEVSKKAYEQVSERARSLDEELTKLRTELESLRSERDKAVLEADFARDRLNGFAAELEHQRKESNSASLRNAELTRLVVDYERRLREDLDSKQALEENLRKLSMEVSTLKNAKESLEKSERRALDEVRDLTERVHRLQATIDTIHTTEEVQENARSMERRNHEEHIKRLERDWAELNKELQEQRDHVRVLSLDKKNVFDSCMKQVEDMRKELNNSWKAVSDAEARAAIAEAKCSDLEAKVKSRKAISRDGCHEISAASEENDELFQLKEELEKYKEEAQANKNYMVQYKEIAHSNEVALKQLESAHQDYKAETEVGRKALEDEIVNLRDKLSEMEKSYVIKCEEAANAIESKEKHITSLMNEISVLRTEVSQKLPQLEKLEIELALSKSSLDEQYKRWRTAQDNYERQVILQSETIQELTNTSKQLSSLQHEITVLRQTADALKNENECLRSSAEQEKIGLLKEKDDALQKYNELNDQNRILHNQLEALHIRLAEKERNIAGLSSHRTDNSHAEDDLQSVISYLRRSKEIAETEISLLKQEKSRLQIELESSLKSAKEAQDLLRSQADSARALMFKDEEFKSLQIQVREINLLRESNIQLREENRHNFEECQKFREEAQKAKMESERLQNLLLEKEVDAEMCKRELEMQKAEIANLNQSISELIENSKGIDLNTYEAMKNELQNIKSTLRENSMELESAKILLSEKEVAIKILEDKLSLCQSELDSKEKKLNDVEASLKSEIDKHKKINLNLKRKHDNLMKEKGEIAKENQSLVKQMEDLKSTQKTTSETTLEQAIKEKDFRIQTLERTLEKERDDNKKEKAKSRRNENTIFGALQKVQQDKKQVEESIDKHKQAVRELIENYPGLSSEVPPISALEEQLLSYFRAAKDMEESSSPFRDGAATQTPVVETAPVDAPTSAGVAGRPVDTSSRPAKAKMTEERAVPKPSSEVRRPGGRRPLVRPTLERTEEPHADTDISAVDASTVQDKGGPPAEQETSGILPVLQPLSRKRLITSSQTVDSASQGEANDVNPPSKKPKEEESSQGTSELKSGQPPLGDVAAQVNVLPATDDLDGQQPTEEIDTDQAPEPMVEVEATREEDGGDKDDSGDASTDIKGQDADANIDANAIPLEEEHVVAKSEAIIESFDDDRKTEDSKEDAQRTTATDVDDDMEEGELAEEPEDKSDVDMSEIEGEATAERAAVEPDQSPITQPGAADASPSRTADASPAREPSPSPVQAGASSRPQNTSTATEAREPSSNPAQAGASSEQRNTSTVVEAAETRSRTINLSERARQNRQTRFQRAQQPGTARGRGQQSVTLRKDATGRGSRGRGGRGQS